MTAAEFIGVCTRTRTPSEIACRSYGEDRDFVFLTVLRCCAGDRSLSEDVTQDVFVALLRVLRRGTEVPNIRGWLYRTAINRSLTRLQRDRFLRSPTLARWFRTQARHPPTPEELGISDQRLRSAAWVLRDASPKERTCFYMHHLDGHQISEIGRILGHSKGYISKLVSRVERRIAKADQDEQ